MDQGPLVDEQIEGGKRIVDRLAEHGFPITGACWLKEAEAGQWFLYIVTPLVGDDGATKDAYRQLNQVARGLAQPIWVHPLEIKVVEPNGPVGQAILELHKRYPGRSPIRYGGPRFGDINIEGAYVYPPAVALAG